jgi:hypothetical protein
MLKDGDDILEALKDGKTVFISEDIESDGLSAEAAGEYAVNLNGNTLYSTNYVGSWVEDGKLIVSDGIIDASSSGQKIAVYADEGGYVELNNVQVYSPNAANPLQCYGGTMVLNNVTTAQYGVADKAWYNSAIQVVNNITYPEKDPVTNKHVIYGKNANLVVNSGMYSGDKAIQISAPGGNVTINGGTFTGTSYAINGEFAKNNYTHTEGMTYESIIIINGGTFTGNIKFSLDTVLEVNGGTFNFDKLIIGKNTFTGDNLLVEFAKYVKSGVTVTVNGQKVVGTR